LGAVLLQREDVIVKRSFLQRCGKIDRLVEGEIKESNAREIIYYDKKRFWTF